MHSDDYEDELAEGAGASISGSAWMFYNHYNSNLLKAVQDVIVGDQVEDVVNSLIERSKYGYKPDPDDGTASQEARRKRLGRRTARSVAANTLGGAALGAIAGHATGNDYRMTGILGGLLGANRGFSKGDKEHRSKESYDMLKKLALKKKNK